MSMSSLWHMKGYAESQVIDAVGQRLDQRRAFARIVAQLYWSEAV
jgi:hypothetical protein